MINLNTNPSSANEGESIINLNVNVSSTNQIGSIKTKNANPSFDNDPDGLPPGWIIETKFRKSKSTTKKDKLYIDPVNGYVLRSLKDVHRYIKTGDIHECSGRPMKRKGSLTSKTETNSQTSTARLSHPGTAVQRCLFVEEKSDAKLCGEIKSPAEVQLLAQGPANGKLLETEAESLPEENSKLVEETKQEGYTKEQPQPTNLVRGQQLGTRQKKVVKAITEPVRTSKRLATLRADDLTESGVFVELGDGASASDNQLKSNSIKSYRHRSEVLVGILDVPPPSDVPGHMPLEKVQDVTSVGSENKNFQTVNNSVPSPEQNNIVAEMKMEITSSGQSHLVKPASGHQPSAKRIKLTKTMRAPVRASRRLAAIKSDDSERISTDDSGPSISTPNNQLGANSTKDFHHMNEIPATSIDDGYVFKVSNQNQEETPEIVLATVQPDNQGPLVGRVKVLEETAPGLSADEQLQPKKPRRGYSQSSKKEKCIKTVTKPVRASKRLSTLVVKGLATTGVEISDDKLTHDHHLVEKTINDHHSKSPMSVERIEEGSKSPAAAGKLEEEGSKSPAAAGKLEEASKSTASVSFKEQSKPLLATERFEEQSKSPLPSVRFEEASNSTTAAISFQEWSKAQVDTERFEEQSKSPIPTVRFEEASTSTTALCFKERSKPPVATERFEEQSKSLLPTVTFEEALPTTSAVNFKEWSKTPMTSERFGEKSKSPLPTVKCEEQKIEVVSNLGPKEIPERREPHVKGTTQDQVDFRRPDDHKPESQFISLFGDSWPDPCIEFAFKTLTGDIPEDYFQLQQQQLMGSTTRTNNCPGSFANNKSGSLDQSEPLSQFNQWDDLWSFGKNV